MCHSQGHNTVTPVRLEPGTPRSQVIESGTPRSRVKHSTTEPLPSPYDLCKNRIGIIIAEILLFTCEALFCFLMNTASNLCLLLQKEQNVKGGEGPSGKQAVGINNGTR